MRIMKWLGLGRIDLDHQTGQTAEGGLFARLILVLNYSGCFLGWRLKA